MRPWISITANNYNSIKPYVPGSYRNLSTVKYDPRTAGLHQCRAGWNRASRQRRRPHLGHLRRRSREAGKVESRASRCRYRAGYFFSANTIAELAGKVVMKYPAQGPARQMRWRNTVARYNSFVDAGKDDDFDKPAPQYKIQTPPFYAAWATPVIHDSRAGLRINAQCQVVDLNGKVIPGLYCGGESAGGFSEHGLARCTCPGPYRRQGGSRGKSSRLEKHFGSGQKDNHRGHGGTQRKNIKIANVFDSVKLCELCGFQFVGKVGGKWLSRALRNDVRRRSVRRQNAFTVKVPLKQNGQTSLRNFSSLRNS